MNTKKAQLVFLNEFLDTTIKMYLEAEVVYRGIDQLYMRKTLTGKNTEQELLAKRHQSQVNRDGSKLKLDTIRELIQELEDDKFIA